MVASSTTSRSSAQPLDVGAVRSRFPALASGAAFFDGPGGSQVPQEVVDAIASADRNPQDRPVEDVVLQRVVIEQG